MKCWYGGKEIASMEFANWTIDEIRQYERERHVNNDPEPCHGCGAKRKLQWVKRSLGGPGSGCWQWSLIFPHHNQVKRKDSPVASQA